MAQKIYIADDEKSIRDLVKAFLTREGYEVSTYSDGETLLEECNKCMPDLVILDIIMPGIDGFSVCSALRKINTNLPIIIVSAKDSPYDRVTGITLGSDDYMVKPFLPLELVVRVKALLRRTCNNTNDSSNMPEKVKFGDIELEQSYRIAKVREQTLSLTPTEFDFMIYLINNAKRAVSREELLKALWQVDWNTDTRATDDLVKRLRRKLREYNSIVSIETVWGYGFRLSLGEDK